MNVEDRIRQRAHEIWESEGRPEGKESDHWMRARNEIEQSGKQGHSGSGGIETHASQPMPKHTRGH